MYHSAGPRLGETTKVGGAREKARLFENFSILTETLNKCFNFQYVLNQRTLVLVDIEENEKHSLCIQPYKGKKKVEFRFVMLGVREFWSFNKHFPLLLIQDISK